MKRLTLSANFLSVLLTACAVGSPQRAEQKAQLPVAEAMFQERCKKSGEFIYRTAEDVEGVLLLKIREGYNHKDQYRMDDPYGHEPTGENYIKGFFFEPTLLANKYASSEVFETIQRDYRGYRYVDALDPKDGKRYRYTGHVEEPWQTNKNYLKGYTRFVLDKAPAPNPAPRYGVTYDDISTREERDYWIAGSSLKVIDLQTNEVMAERIGYMMDRGQGNTSGERSPWLMAADYACPSFRPSGARVPGSTYQLGQTRKFVTRVLKPSQER